MWSDVKFSLVFWHCRDVSQKQIEVETMSYALRIWAMRLGIWWSEPLRIILIDLLGCQEGGTIFSMFIDKHGFWACDNWEIFCKMIKKQLKLLKRVSIILCVHNSKLKLFIGLLPATIDTLVDMVVKLQALTSQPSSPLCSSEKLSWYFWWKFLDLKRTSGIKISANKWEWKFSDRSQLGC